MLCDIWHPLLPQAAQTNLKLWRKMQAVSGLLNGVFKTDATPHVSAATCNPASRDSAPPPLQALSFEEAQARRDRLAKMRALLFYHELKARRVKAIKSKEYHRRLNRAAKRKAAKAGEAGDDNEALRAAAEDAEFERVKVLRLQPRPHSSVSWPLHRDCCIRSVIHIGDMCRRP